MIVKDNKQYGVETRIIDTGEPVLQDITITSNGEYTADTSQGYNGLGVVTASVQPNLTTLNATQNGNYTPSGYDGYSSVTVNVSSETWPEYLRVWYLPTESDTYIQPTAISSGFNRCRIQGETSWMTYSPGSIPMITPSDVETAGADWRKFYVDFELTNPTTILGGAFSFMYTVVKVELPEAVTTIGDNCFNNCRNLQVIPNLSNITYLGRDVFYSVGLYTDNVVIDDDETRDWQPGNSWHCSDYAWVNGTFLEYKNGSFENAVGYWNQRYFDFRNGIDGRTITKFYANIVNYQVDEIRFPATMTDMTCQIGAGTLGDAYFYNPVPPTVVNNDPPIHPVATITGHIYVPQGSLTAYQTAFPTLASYMLEMS